MPEGLAGIPMRRELNCAPQNKFNLQLECKLIGERIVRLERFERSALRFVVRTLSQQLPCCQRIAHQTASFRKAQRRFSHEAWQVYLGRIKLTNLPDVYLVGLPLALSNEAFAASGGEPDHAEHQGPKLDPR
jgi:hypothetical protein